MLHAVGSAMSESGGVWIVAGWDVRIILGVGEASGVRGYSGISHGSAGTIGGKVHVLDVYWRSKSTSTRSARYQHYIITSVASSIVSNHIVSHHSLAIARPQYGLAQLPWVASSSRNVIDALF